MHLASFSTKKKQPYLLMEACERDPLNFNTKETKQTDWKNFINAPVCSI